MINIFSAAELPCISQYLCINVFNFEMGEEGEEPIALFFHCFFSNGSCSSVLIVAGSLFSFFSCLHFFFIFLLFLFKETIPFFQQYEFQLLLSLMDKISLKWINSLVKNFFKTVGSLENKIIYFILMCVRVL